MEIEASYTLFRLNNNLGIRGEKMKTIIGIFSDRIDVEDAIEELRDSGFDAKDVSIVMQDKKESAAIANDTGANVAGGAVSGATTGAVLGGLAGLVSAIALPGLGAFFIGGPIAAALGLTGAAAATVSGVTTGAVAGGLVGALIGMGLPQDEAEYYEGRVREGAILVAIPATSTAQQDEIVRILDGFDAGLAHDHVAAVAVVEQRDDLALRAIGAVHERIGRDRGDGVDFTGRECIERREIIEPHELDIESRFLEPAFLLGDFEHGVARPVRVADLELGGVGKCGREQAQAGDDERFEFHESVSAGVRSGG